MSEDTADTLVLFTSTLVADVMNVFQKNLIDLNDGDAVYKALVALVAWNLAALKSSKTINESDVPRLAKWAADEVQRLVPRMENLINDGHP